MYKLGKWSVFGHEIKMYKTLLDCQPVKSPVQLKFVNSAVCILFVSSQIRLYGNP